MKVIRSNVFLSGISAGFIAEEIDKLICRIESKRDRYHEMADEVIPELIKIKKKVQR